MNENLAAKLKNISQSPGVYIMKNINGDVIYVGKAKNLKKRVPQYFSGKNAGVKTEHLVSKIYDIETIISANELEAFLLETPCFNYIGEAGFRLCKFYIGIRFVVFKAYIVFWLILLYQSIFKKESFQFVGGNYSFYIVNF